MPLVPDGRLSVLELFHGPTAAFKDFGARLLAACLVRLRTHKSHPLTILVATSGDTGGAVAAAFHERPGIEVAVLFPKGLVSPTQERQLTCWGGNVKSFAVRGTFDDCQRLVKQAFVDPQLRERSELSSANSINLGRLLPQAVYYAAASLAIWREHAQPASFVVPSGNLGNAVACVWARRLGLPMLRVVNGWCVFFNQGCVLHKVGAVEGDKYRYKPAACALFPLARDEHDQWYPRPDHVARDDVVVADAREQQRDEDRRG